MSREFDAVKGNTQESLTNIFNIHYLAVQKIPLKEKEKKRE